MQRIESYVNAESLEKAKQKIRGLSMKSVISIVGLLVVFIFCLFVLMLDSTETVVADSRISLKNDVSNNDQVRLVLFTTFSSPKEGEDDDVTDIQKNTLHYLSLMDNIIPIVYTDSEFWIEECKNYKIKAIADFERNPYNLPYLFGMFERSIEEYPNEDFYGYINGDILVENSIHKVLIKVKQDIQDGNIKPKVGLFSQRHNFYFNSTTDMYIQSNNMTQLYQQQKLKARSYWDAAIDLFVFTPNTFDWKNMPKFVIGRAKFDNWVIQHVTRAVDIDSIDITFLSQIIHQTGKFGNRSGVKKLKTNLREVSKELMEIPVESLVKTSEYERSKNHGWNNVVLSSMGIPCCEDIWFQEQSSHVLIPIGKNGDMCIAKKYTSTYFEDDYQNDEIILMNKYIKPNSNCLVLAEGSINGYENSFCEHTTALLYDLTLCNYSKQRIESCPSLQSRYTILCTGSRPDLYLDEYLAPLKYIETKFDVTIVLIKKGQRLLKKISFYLLLLLLLLFIIYIYMSHTPYIFDSLPQGTDLLLVRRWDKEDIKRDFIKGMKKNLNVMEVNARPVPMEGPHFPYLGLAAISYKKVEGGI
ncbi:hypothetical protein WA158_002505 [Blastocystis sp. Blastoise]